MNSQWKSKIEDDVKNNEIMVYMRGSPQAPRCGFSAKVIRTLNELGRPFKSDDMDSDPELWSTLKEMNNWPTSPQIFIKGEINGNDSIHQDYAGCAGVFHRAASGIRQSRPGPDQGTQSQVRHQPGRGTSANGGCAQIRRAGAIPIPPFVS